MSAVKRIWAWLSSTVLYRSYQAYGKRRGSLLSSGIAFTGLFSLFGVLATGFTGFALVLGTKGALYTKLLETIETNLPGLLKTPANPDGAIDPATLIQSNLWSTGGAIAFLTTLWAGLSWIDAVREGVRAMLDQPTFPANIVVTKLTDVANLVFIGLGVLGSAVLGVVVSSASSRLLELGHLGSSGAGQAAVRVATFLLVLAADAGLLLVIFRFMSRLELPWRDVRRGVLTGALALGILKQFAGLALSRAGGNPLLASAAVLVGLLVWLNLVSQVILVSAAVVNTDIADALARTRAAAGGTPAVSLDKLPPIADDPGPELAERAAWRRLWARLRGA